MSNTVRMVMPPDGEWYNFPKPIPSFKTKNDFRKWMLLNGYPEELINQSQLDYCKFLIMEIPLDNEDN